jgi:hypothetical protein
MPDNAEENAPSDVLMAASPTAVVRATQGHSEAPTDREGGAVPEGHGVVPREKTHYVSIAPHLRTYELVRAPKQVSTLSTTWLTYLLLQ